MPILDSGIQGLHLVLQGNISIYFKICLKVYDENTGRFLIFDAKVMAGTMI